MTGISDSHGYYCRQEVCTVHLTNSPENIGIALNIHDVSKVAV